MKSGCEWPCTDLELICMLSHHRHTGEALRTVKYHGPNRPRDLDTLENSDLVITTYNTLATEFANKKSQALLHKIFWYRVVLDEGSQKEHTFKRSYS